MSATGQQGSGDLTLKGAGLQAGHIQRLNQESNHRYQKILIEQFFWNEVISNPGNGIALKLYKDKRFPKEAGFIKVEVSPKLPDGSNITIHYQYN